MHAHESSASHPVAGPDRHDATPARRLRWVLALTLAFAVVEAGGGVVSGSLALLADAGHMVADASAMLLALLATWLAGRQATARHTYGFRRAEFLAAFVNALGLVVLAGWIVVEAVARIGAPRPVLGGVMLWVALAGLAVNAIAIRILHGHGQADLNLKSALWHVLGDLFGSLGAVTAALVIAFTGWTLADPVLSIAIALLIGVAGGRIVVDSATLLMDRVPSEIDVAEVRRFLESHPHVEQICDLHVWGVSSRQTLLTAHLVVRPDVDRDGLLHVLLPALQSRFGVDHLTLQLESDPHESCREAV